ncbi:hypothetical protein LIER_20316 [Lithospermum erythrorhizon]|uniref:Uncharacterized protein n=1 Tax=Lithospermum erythrorhizon TaxID=34254 RepID=A0AAV3QMH7_LITER
MDFTNVDGKSSCCHSCFPPREQFVYHPLNEQITCSHRLTESACNVCILCVCCPLSLAWSCIKVPCKIGKRLVWRAKRGACCGWGEKKKIVSYSSFSDLDYEYVQSSQGYKGSSKTNLVLNFSSGTEW